MVGASTPQAGATRSGVNSASAGSRSASPSASPASRPGRQRASAIKVCAMAARSRASLPGRIATCWSARAAVSERLGSTTTSRPPRAFSARTRPRKSRHREEAAVRRHRVGAEHEQVVGAIDVRDRHAERRAEHQPGGDLLGELIERAGRIAVARAERRQQRLHGEGELGVVRHRIAEVDRQAVGSVGVEERAQAPPRWRRRLRPRRPGRGCRRASASVCADDSGPRAGP